MTWKSEGYIATPYRQPWTQPRLYSLTKTGRQFVVATVLWIVSVVGIFAVSFTAGRNDCWADTVSMFGWVGPVAVIFAVMTTVQAVVRWVNGV